MPDNAKTTTTYLFYLPYEYSSIMCFCVLLSDRVNSKKRETIVGRVKALLAGDPELKEAAKRAVIAYLRSLHLASNKRLFHVDQLDMAAFAEFVYSLIEIIVLVRGIGRIGQSENRREQKIPYCFEHAICTLCPYNVARMD